MRVLFLLVLLLAAPSWAAEFAVVQCALPTVNGNSVDCTSTSFGTPLGAFVWGGYGTANGTVVNHAGLWMGAYDGTRQHSRAFASEDGQLDSDTGAVVDADSALITLLNTSQAKDGDCTASFITDGIRLTCADAPPAAYLANVVLIGGSGVSSVYTDTATSNATVNLTTAVTVPGFEPDLVLVWSNNNDTTNWSSSIGWATNEGGSVVQRSVAMLDSNADANMIVTSRLATNRVVMYPAPGGSIATIELTSFDANGFTVTTRDASAAIPFSYLAVKFNSLSVKTITSAAPTSTGSQAVTGVGFTPQFGFMLQGEFAAVDTQYASDNGEVQGISAFTASASASAATAHEDGDSTSNTESMTDSKVCRTRKDAADYATCTLTSFDSDGATFNYTATNGTARQRAILFVQAAAVGAAARRLMAPLVFE